MIRASLASSDGWNWNGPSWNQAWVPRRSVPSGESTSEQDEQRTPA